MYSFWIIITIKWRVRRSIPELIWRRPTIVPPRKDFWTRTYDTKIRYDERFVFYNFGFGGDLPSRLFEFFLWKLEMLGRTFSTEAFWYLISLVVMNLFHGADALYFLESCRMNEKLVYNPLLSSAGISAVFWYSGLWSQLTGWTERKLPQGNW